MTKCNEVMTRDPLFCLPTEGVAKVAEKMARNSVGPILIVADEPSRKLVGIVTDRDLALKVVAEERDSKTTKVEDVMTRKVVTVKADDDIEKALEMMTDLQLRRLPVVDGNDRLIGILAQADVATRLDKPAVTAAVVKGISQDRG